MTDRILRRLEVEARTGLARATIYARLKNQDFPEPVRLGKRAIGWRESDISAWLSSRPSAYAGAQNNSATETS